MNCFCTCDTQYSVESVIWKTTTGATMLRPVGIRYKSKCMCTPEGHTHV